MGDATTTCTIEGCGAKIYGRGWCSKHYQRWWKNGDPVAVKPRPKRPLSERFWEKVDAEGDCWEWNGTHTQGGYGTFKIDGTMKVVHRVAWELLIGPIAEGMQLDHLCRNRGCLNPSHLEEVTPTENVRRGMSAIPGGHQPQARKTHCKNGHEFTFENTYISKGKKGRTARKCRKCTYDYRLEYHARKKLERMGL